jgi:hypothetical protein
MLAMPSSSTIAVSVALIAFGATFAWSGDAMARAHKRRRGGGFKRARAVIVVPPPPRISVPDATPAPQVSTLPPRAPASSLFGHVQFATEHRAYLDRGSAEGLLVGQWLPIARGVRSIGSCKIETVGDHEATCTGARLRPGDAFRTPRNGGRKARAPAPVMAPILDDKTLEGRAAQIADTTIDKVDFNGKRAYRSRGTAEATPGFVTWFTQPNGGNGAYAQERIDGIIRGVEIGNSGFRFDGAFSAIRWNTPTVERFRPTTPTQFYLWEAEAYRRVQDGGTTLAVGRLWPHHTPGLTLLDGMQLGRESEAHTAEGGVYGGLIPTADGVVPTFDIWTTGLYGALSQPGTKASRIRLAREEIRVGVWRAATTGAVAEGEGMAQTWIGPVTAGGGGRVSWAAEQHGHAVLENAFVDLGVRPSLESGVGLHARYVGVSLLQQAPLRAETPMTAGAMHAIADAYRNFSSRLALAGSVGAHREDATGRYQVHGGAELRFPRMFGETGGLWVGATVEQGWLQGESAYVQFLGHFSERFQVLARLSGDGTRFETPTAVWNLNELAATLSVDGAIATRLRLRAWSMVRAPILVQGVLPIEAGGGGVVGISLAGAI